MELPLSLEDVYGMDEKDQRLEIMRRVRLGMNGKPLKEVYSFLCLVCFSISLLFTPSFPLFWCTLCSAYEFNRVCVGLASERGWSAGGFASGPSRRYYEKKVALPGIFHPGPNSLSLSLFYLSLSVSICVFTVPLYVSLSLCSSLVWSHHIIHWFSELQRKRARSKKGKPARNQAAHTLAGDFSISLTVSLDSPLGFYIPSFKKKHRNDAQELTSWIVSPNSFHSRCHLSVSFRRTIQRLIDVGFLHEGHFFVIDNASIHHEAEVEEALHALLATVGARCIFLRRIFVVCDVILTALRERRFTSSARQDPDHRYVVL
jgi:hypothetical protein